MMEIVMQGGLRTAQSPYLRTKVLVTGADGFIGSHLVERLVDAGAHVTALCLYNSFDSLGWIDDVAPEIRRRLTVTRGDVRDPTFMRRLMSDQEIVFHLAALIAIPYSYVAAHSYVETNVLGTLNVLEAARELRVGRVVHTSTSEVYGSAITVPISEDHPLQAQSPYSASKIGADMLAVSFARSFDLPVAILRPFNTFGPRQSERAVIPTLIRQALDPSVESIRIGDLRPIRDFSYVADTVQAFMAIGTAADVAFGQPYNAGSGVAVTIGEVVDLVRSLTDCRKAVVRDDQRLRPIRSEVRELLADSSKFRELTGWRPRISMKDGLSRSISWWRDRLKSSRVRIEATYAT